MKITREDPLSPDGMRLLAASQAALEAVFAADEIFTFSPEELAGAGTDFFVARDAEGRAMGCVASCDMGDYREVKRLVVLPEARGQGAAKALMAHLEAAAKAEGKAAVRLETGDALVAATALYARLGYARRGPFGDYRCHPASTFMEKAL